MKPILSMLGFYVALDTKLLASRLGFGDALLDAGLPERVTHNDAKLNNVLFDARSGEGLCVVDLDTVMPGLALYDFGEPGALHHESGPGGRA